MNAKENMIIIKNEIKTNQVERCQYNPSTEKMEVEFSNGKMYPYNAYNVKCLKNPTILDGNSYRISRAGKIFYGIAEIYVFKDGISSYWHICFQNGTERDYKEEELKIETSCLKQKGAGEVFEYIKQVAYLNELKNEETGENILAKRFDKITFVGEDVALAKYLRPSTLQKKEGKSRYIPIFPFGCNKSQYQAVKSAMENQISVIQGPPGTGKTQTILNIIANILMQGKTVQVVSNNNAAIENIYEKLAKSEYNLHFIVATLGSSKNKEAFIAQQCCEYPDFSTWKLEEEQSALQNSIFEKSILLEEIYEKQEELALLKQEKEQLRTEFTYFREYADKNEVVLNDIKAKKQLVSNRWMKLWQDCQRKLEKTQKIGILFKIKVFFKYGILNKHFYKLEMEQMILLFQLMYYQTKQAELSKRIEEIERYLKKDSNGLLDSLCKQSMQMIKNTLAEKYEKKGTRNIFKEEDFVKNPYDVLEEYPVILSTTFSARSSLHRDVVYDYIIMDEASQIDIATGALALSCARNAVIVGDTKQLSNIVKPDMKKKTEEIFSKFCISEGYQFTKSFLQSILEVMPQVTETMLREHYRCHPKIINFCNQKFYRGQLRIMTEDHGEKDVLTVIKTVPGQHVRNRYSQRQIDVIRNEILPNYVVDAEKTGIIAPYKNQTEALEREFREIDAATVHKFQGREKDTIIISTVDDEISDFVDDPYLINVAVSRAKKKLMLVVTGNEQKREGNITDLMAYIQYNNFKMIESKTNSVFDYLYKQYTKERNAYLQRHRRISQYDSENLMYALLEDILSGDKYASLDVLCHFPMNMLIRDTKMLDEKESSYAMHPATHIDFLIYSMVSKKPVLAVEVDGYTYHKTGTAQASRDQLKNHILKLYEIPFLRLRTNGSGEKEKIIEILDTLVR